MSLALRTPRPTDQTEQSAGQATDARDVAIEHDDGLLAVAGPIMVVCYVLLFAIAAVTFFSSGSAFFAVGISIVFAVVYFAIPVVFFRIRAARDQRWLKDEHATSPVVEVWTGSMRRWEALVQIVAVPLAILMGFTLLAIRWSML